LLVNCRRWLQDVLPRRRVDVVLFGNELRQQFPLNAYGGIEASVDTMAWTLHDMGIPFWVITPGRSTDGARTAYPFDVLETEIAPNGRGGLVGPYVEQSLKILSERRDHLGVVPTLVEYAHGNASSAADPMGGRNFVVWGQSDWSQAFTSGSRALAGITSHHDGGGPINGWDRGIPNVMHRFLSNDQRNKWVREESDVRDKLRATPLPSLLAQRKSAPPPPPGAATPLTPISPLTAHPFRPRSQISLRELG
jgi:hypothetical protein